MVSTSLWHITPEYGLAFDLTGGRTGQSACQGHKLDHFGGTLGAGIGFWGLCTKRSDVFLNFISLKSIGFPSNYEFCAFFLKRRVDSLGGTRLYPPTDDMSRPNAVGGLGLLELLGFS